MPVETGPIRTRFQSQGAEKVALDATHVQRALQTASGGAAGLTGALANMGPAAGAAVAALAIVGAEVQAWVRVIQSAVRTFQELGTRGGEVAAVARYFESIATREQLQRLGELANWQISQIDLMRSYSLVQSAASVSMAEYQEWTERVTRAAQDLDNADPAATLQSVMRALAGGRVSGLGRTLGIDIQIINAALREQGVSLQSVEGRSLAASLALEQLRQIQGDVDNTSTNLADAWGALNTRTGDMRDELSRLVSESPPLVAFFDTLQRNLGVSEGGMRALARQIALVTVAILDMLAGTAEGVVQFMRGMSIIHGTVIRWLSQLPGLGGLRSHLEDAVRIENLLENVEGRIARIRGAMQKALQTGGLLAGEEAQRSRRPSLGAGGARGRGRAREAERPMSRAEEQAGAFLRETEPLLARSRDLMAEIDALAASVAETEQEWGEEQTRRLEEQRMLKEAGLEIAEKEAELAEQQAAADTARVDAMKALANEAARYISAGTQAASIVTQALDDHISSREQEIQLELELGKISQAQAERQLRALDTERKVLGSIKAAVNFVDAAAEIAKAVGSYPDIAGIIAHSLSATGHIVAGGMALAQLGGSASPPPGLAAPSSVAQRAEYAPDRRERESAQAATASIMLVSLTSAAMAREMARAERTRLRIGMPAGMAGAAGRR